MVRVRASPSMSSVHVLQPTNTCPPYKPLLWGGRIGPGPATEEVRQRESVYEYG